MNKMKFLQTLFTIISVTLFFSFFSSCEDGGPSEGLPEFIQVGEATRNFENVDERLWVYFERFEDAALERGINIDLEASNVTGTIGDEPGHNSPGACEMNTNGTLHRVSLREDFWASASVTDKEIIVFHELGHCYLNRQHLDLALPNGTCVSLMRTGGNVCSDNYFVGTRDYYLDELFGI